MSTADPLTPSGREERLDLDALEKVARSCKSDFFDGVHVLVHGSQDRRADETFVETFDPPTVLRLIAAARHPISSEDDNAGGADTARAGANTDGCEWPDDQPFRFVDEPGEHEPCYVVMPGGACLPLNHDCRPGVDIARARWIVAACNAALSPVRADTERVGEGWRPEVVAFADAMETKLRANDHKGGWKDEHADRLKPRLIEEIEELAAAVRRGFRTEWFDWTPDEPLPAPGNCEIFQWQSGGYRVRSLEPAWRAGDYSRKAILAEAADVANFAMMIADVCGALSAAPTPTQEGADDNAGAGDTGGRG